jgi:hypothetical protein
MCNGICNDKRHTYNGYIGTINLGWKFDFTRYNFTPSCSRSHYGTGKRTVDYALTISDAENASIKEKIFREITLDYLRISLSIDDKFYKYLATLYKDMKVLPNIATSNAYTVLFSDEVMQECVESPRSAIRITAGLRVSIQEYEDKHQLEVQLAYNKIRIL